MRVMAWEGNADILQCMAEDYPVHVVRVIDGDSVRVRLPDGGEHSVRMYGIDAPEKDQRGGRESHEYLRRVVRSRRGWRLRVVDVDRYQRLVGVLYAEGESVRQSANHLMVEAGWAYWYREYGGRELGFDSSERVAKRERAGVWSERDPVRPWDHRRYQRADRKRKREAAESPAVVLIGGLFKLVVGMLKIMVKASAQGGGRRRRRRRRRW